MITIGVLAMQGAVAEHLACLSRLPGVRGVPVKTAESFHSIDGLILPGGESTAIGKLLSSFGLLQPLQEKIRAGFPVWGTCAGLILLAKKIAGEPLTYLGAMDITARRNAYGGQLDSFRTEIHLTEISDAPIPLVFIRAPYIEQAGNAVQTLAAIDGKIVAARQENLLVTAFHPELTQDLGFHRYFVDKIVGKTKENQ